MKYNMSQFKSKEEHLAELCYACSLIVNTYIQTDLLDDLKVPDYINLSHLERVTTYSFIKFSQHITRQIANETSV